MELNTNANVDDFVATYNQNIFIAKPFEPSGWRCELFGMGPTGIVWTPSVHTPIPNWFWRKMQFLILGNRWTKT